MSTQIIFSMYIVGGRCDDGFHWKNDIKDRPAKEACKRLEQCYYSSCFCDMCHQHCSCCY